MHDPPTLSRALAHLLAWAVAASLTSCSKPSGAPGVTSPPAQHQPQIAQSSTADAADQFFRPEAKPWSATPLLNGAKPTDPNLSVSTILTSDDLPKVAAWYHDHLPGWSEQNLGQMAMFWPPDRKADPRTVWLVVDPKTGQTGAILWKTKNKTP